MQAVTFIAKFKIKPVSILNRMKIPVFLLIHQYISAIIKIGVIISPNLVAFKKNGRQMFGNENSPPESPNSFTRILQNHHCLRCRITTRWCNGGNVSSCKLINWRLGSEERCR